MDVDHALRECVEQNGCDDTHEAGEYDPRDIVVAERVDHRGVEGLSRAEVFVVHDARRHACGFGAREALDARTVGDHEAYACIESSGADCIENGLEVGSAAGDEDTEVERHGREHRSRGDGERHFAAISCRARAPPP